MKFSSAISLAIAFASAARAESVAVDARRGAGLFSQQRCNTCHIGGAATIGGAPDLARYLDRAYTAAGIASRMWNHAPEMWRAMRDSKIAVPELTESNAADLFAFFYASRYFEKPGDAGRGRNVFLNKQCAACHGITAETGPGLPVSRWGSLSDPVELVQHMWNHALDMNLAAAKWKVKWPRIAPAELSDLLVYLRNLPGMRNRPARFEMAAGGERGKQLIAGKGCAGCHKGGMALENRLHDRTLTEVAAAMWNHAPQMAGRAASLTVEETREILGYVWAADFTRARGDASRGRKTFSTQCGGCHEKGAAPKLAARADGFTTVTLISALWRHGPKMLGQLEAEGKAWPRLSPPEMANLVAFLDLNRRK